MLPRADPSMGGGGAATTPARRGRDTPAAYTFGGMSRILVAEDDADIAALVRHYLEKAAYTVDVTDSGRDVLPRLRRTPVDR